MTHRKLVAWTVAGLLAGGACYSAEYTTYSDAMQSGREHLEARRLEAARTAFTAAAGLTENRHERALARVHVGHAAYAAGAYAEARARYAEVLSEPGLAGDPRVLAHQFTGHTHLQEGVYSAALAAYREARQGARPTLSRNLANDIAFTCREAVLVGIRHYRLGDFAASREALRIALALEDLPPREAARAWLTLGHVLARQGAAGEAGEAYRKVLEVKTEAPDPWLHSEALLALGRLLQEAGETGKAREAWRRLLAMGRHAHPRHRMAAEDILRQSGETTPPLQADYGAGVNPTGSPVGGGAGYAEAFTSGDIAVATVEELLAALQDLARMEHTERSEKVVFLQPGTELNLAGQTAIGIPSGVTLAGDRGADGSPGPLLYTDQPLSGFALFNMGSGARLSGVRLRGDGLTFRELFSDWPHSYFRADIYDRLGRQRPSVVAITSAEDVRIDNNIIGQFARGVSVTHNGVRIQHNILHDISPYPIVTSAGSFNPLIEANIIDWAWHAVATSDHMTASYTMRYNIIRETSPNLLGQGVSGCFALDHHGQGEYFLIHHNTFEHEDPTESVPGRAIALAPVWDSARVYGNHFVDYMRAEDATYWVNQQPAKGMTDLREIVTRRDLSRYLQDYLAAIEDFSQFDLREIVAMTRAGVGGENLWFFDNAYGPERAVLEVSIFTTPRIFLQQPSHRKVRTRLGAGRGGETHPALMHLRGTVPLVMAVEVLPPHKLTEVSVDLIVPDTDRLYAGGYRATEGERRRLYSGRDAPEPGSVTLDTTELADGVYGLIVTAGDDRGIRAHHTTFFEIVNPRD